MKRIDELTSPPEVGAFYLVPTVIGEWCSNVQAWPVIGPEHNDKECLNFDHRHYHLDARFLPCSREEQEDEWFWRSAFGSPMQVNTRCNPGGLPEPVWLRRKCKRAGNPFIDKMVALSANCQRHSGWDCHFNQWTGKQARHDGRGWICPHRNVPLADHAAVNGVITCPLHLLRIDAATGIVLPPVASAGAS